MKIEIMDTTLRDGEQTNGVSFSPEEKLAIAKMLLEEVKVDRIEVGNALVSGGEKNAIGKICAWAKNKGCLNKIEVLGFVDYKTSVNWIKETGCKTVNLLTKGSKKHCEVQLRKSQDEHFEDIKKTVEYAHENGMDANAYLEDWSNGMLESKEYVFSLIALLKSLKVKRIMLPDTLGILNFEQTSSFIKEVISKFPDTWFDFHAHNDYGIGTANAIAAVNAGAKGIHTTVNCLGERAGNVSLDEACVALKDFYGIRTNIDEKYLKQVSRLVETFSGKRISASKPISGDDVFTQTAGIHADGDKKGNLYSTKLSPERFNRQRSYALGKLSGKASLEMNLKNMELDLNDEQKKVLLKKIIELGDKKKEITKDDIPFIVQDIIKTPDRVDISIKDFQVLSKSGSRPVAKISLLVKNQVIAEESEGDGGFDAFMNCLKKIEPKLDFKLPKLVDYSVRIPPGGMTDAIVATTITWENHKTDFKTIGVDTDQVVAAIKATEKMLNRMHRESSNQK